MTDHDDTADYGHEGICPACGEFISYCPGHGPMGDPHGAETLRLHDLDIHNVCHELADCKADR